MAGLILTSWLDRWDGDLGKLLWCGVQLLDDLDEEIANIILKAQRPHNPTQRQNEGIIVHTLNEELILSEGDGIDDRT